MRIFAKVGLSISLPGWTAIVIWRPSGWTHTRWLPPSWRYSDHPCAFKKARRSLNFAIERWRRPHPVLLPFAADAGAEARAPSDTPNGSRWRGRVSVWSCPLSYPWPRSANRPAKRTMFLSPDAIQSGICTAPAKPASLSARLLCVISWPIL